MDNTRARYTLSEWMDLNKISIEQMANLVGCNIQSIINWRNGWYKPHRLNRREIMRITNYEVKI